MIGDRSDMSSCSETIAQTPDPPYTAVIFTSVRSPGDNGYSTMASRMSALASQQPGFLGMEAARETLGITVSYWADDSAAASWKRVAEHLVAQARGRSDWYVDYEVRVCTVTRAYGPSGPVARAGSARRTGDAVLPPE